MMPLDDACPFNPEARASQCQGCVAHNESAPPCVKAWLESEMGLAGRGNVIPLHMARRKRAA
jgi:hypothetical protein